MKKLSDLMIAGYAMVGKQCVGDYFQGKDSTRPCAVCAAGAAYLALWGDANGWDTSVALERLFGEFYEATGVLISDLNDEGMSIPDIAGIAAAEGL